LLEGITLLVLSGHHPVWQVHVHKVVDGGELIEAWVVETNRGYFTLWFELLLFVVVIIVSLFSAHVHCDVRLTNEK
jgi:hypothetical protein